MYIHAREIPSQTTIVVEIDPALVRTGDTASVLQLLQSLARPEMILPCRGAVALLYKGYEEDPRPLFAIPELRQFIDKLTESFPFWLHYLPKEGNALMEVLICLLPIDTEGHVVVPHDLLLSLAGTLFAEVATLYHRNGIPQTELDRTAGEFVDYYHSFP